MSVGWRSLVLAVVVCTLCIPVFGFRAVAQSAAATPYPYRIFLPVVSSAAPRVCTPIPEESYTAIPVGTLSPDPGVPAEAHPDLNLALRSYRENLSAYRGLVQINGLYDTLAPRLQTLFLDERLPGMSHVYQVHQWDGNWPGVYGVYPITDPEVTLAGLISTPGEKVRVPFRAPEIFDDTIGRHYVGMVLYAAPDRITIQYTRDDTAATGYTIHIEGICVEPQLVALYNQTNAAGRYSLPGLQFGQSIGRAAGAELGVAIRDTGRFMDPRSRKDWWQGLVAPGALEVPTADASGEGWYQEQQARLAERAALEAER
ncbi:MAG: hypothetical protein ACYCYF_09730 [Anaerolineae bacterium]